jgi:putative transcriptional regulator
MRATPWRRVQPGRVDALGRVCALVVVATAALMAARPAATSQPGPEVVVRELGAGKLIVAARHLPDPNFTDTVVLLVEYSRDGAAGVVINRPSDVPLSRALPDLAAAAGAGATAFMGGPVSPQAVIALSRTACDRCRSLGRDVYLVNTPEALKERLSRGTDVRQLRVYLGYAGWSSGQLEVETRKGAWHVLGADARLVFDPDPRTMWQRAIRRTEAVLASLRASPRSLPGARWRWLEDL